MKLSLKICSFFFIVLTTFSNCNRNNQTTPKDTSPPTTTQESRPVTKKEKPIPKVKPYYPPKSIAELLSQQYLVDTIYSKVIPNREGNDDDESHIIFNKIIGIVSSSDENQNQIIPLKTNSYFDPVFEYEKDKFIIPFTTDYERETLIFTKWKKIENELHFDSYFKNSFNTKYAAIRMIDFVKNKNQTFLLGEKHQYDEGPTSHSIWVAKLIAPQELEIIKNYQLDKIDIDSFSQGFSLEILDMEVVIKKEDLVFGKVSTN